MTTEAIEEFHNTRTEGVDGIITAEFGANTRMKSGPQLTNNNIAIFNLLTAKDFNPPPLTGTVAFLSGFPLGFSVGHV